MSKTITAPLKWHGISLKNRETDETIQDGKRLTDSGSRGAGNTDATLTTTPSWLEDRVMADSQSTSIPVAQQEVEYRDIPGFPGYLAGSDGSIWSCWQFKGGGYARPGKQIIGTRRKRLKPDRRKEDGRARYTLKSETGGYRRLYGARFVLMTFVGPCPEGMETCHNDGNCLNDAIANLRWGTHAANLLDKNEHGTGPIGERSSTAVLTDGKVLNIRRRRFEGESLKSLATEFGVTEANICAICKGRTWKHV